MRAFFLLTVIVGLTVITFGCAKSTTPTEPAAEGDTPAATTEHEVMKPVVEEPRSETETTEPVTEPPVDTQPDEPAADEAQEKPPATEAAKEPGASEPN
jgi:hypothetical protein